MDDLYRIILNTVNKAICMVYAPAPISGQVAAQSLWFADSLIAVSVNISEELLDALEGFLILL